MEGTRKEDGSMTKSDLIEAVANKLQLPKGKAELIVNCIFDAMEDSLKKGERIEIRGFGSFEIRHYKAYEGRNPRTGDPVGVQPKRLPFFKVGKELKERVNRGFADGNSSPDGHDDDDDEDSNEEGNSSTPVVASGSGG
jgi:integration host factor subunit beta